MCPRVAFETQNAVIIDSERGHRTRAQLQQQIPTFRSDPERKNQACTEICPRAVISIS